MWCFVERARLGAHARFIVLAVLIILGGTVSTYVSNYMTTYAIAALKLPQTTALTATVVGGVALFVGALAGGWLADRYGRRGVMLWPRLLLTLTTWPPVPAAVTAAERRHALS